jgi:hypothetical protein
MDMVGWHLVIQIWPGGDNAAGVEGKQIAVVVALDRLNVAGVGYPRQLVQAAQVGAQVGVVLNAAAVALKQAVVDHVKAKQGGKQPHIRQGNGVAAEKGVLSQGSDRSHQGSQIARHGAIVGGLGLGKAAAVDAVVHGLVGTLVPLVDVGLERLGVEV